MKPNLAEDIIPVSSFRKKTADYLMSLRKGDRTLVLTQDGHSAAVVLSPEAFEKMQYERELLLAISRGEREILQGKGESHESVFRKLFERLE